MFSFSISGCLDCSHGDWIPNALCSTTRGTAQKYYFFSQSIPLPFNSTSQPACYVSVQALYVAYCDLCGCITITDLRISPGFSFY